MNFDNFLHQLASPALRAIALHWNEARGNAAMPGWEQLQPSRMAAHLSIVWAYKYDRSKDQFSGRLAGSSLVWNLQKSFRGLLLGDIWPADTTALIHEKMRHMVSEPAICRMTGALFRQGERVIVGERIALPLASDGVHGDGVLGASVYDDPIRSLALGPVELLKGDEEWFSVTGGERQIAPLRTSA